MVCNFPVAKTSEDYQVGEFIFCREGGCIDLVEVLENESDDSGIRLKLRTAKTCNNYESLIGSEFNFFYSSSGGGCFGMASVGKEYPSYSVCSVLKKQLARMGLSYQDILDSSQDDYLKIVQ